MEVDGIEDELVEEGVLGAFEARDVLFTDKDSLLQVLAQMSKQLDAHILSCILFLII